MMRNNRRNADFWYVYVDTRLDTNVPFYVGKGNLGRVKRAERNSRHRNIVALHGFRRDQVFGTSNELDALELEVFLIRDLKTRNYHGGANFTDGGDGVSGYKHTPETREKDRLSKLGLTYAKEACDKRRGSMLASKRLNRKRVRQFDLNDVFVVEHESLCSAERSLGKPGVATLISRCCRGKTATCCGYKWRYVDRTDPIETQRKRAVTRAIRQIDPVTMNVIAVFASFAAAARSLQRNPENIRSSCNVEGSRAYGFVWRFVD